MFGRGKSLFFAAALSCSLFGEMAALSARPLSLELSASVDRLSEVAGEVEVSFVVRNPDPLQMPVGGFQAFLRFPAATFEPVEYRPIDLRGFYVKNGPPPFGAGFDGCDASVPDRWDDGLGSDVVAVVASAYSAEGSALLRSGSANLGAFVFRLRPGAGAQETPAAFSLEFESCSSRLQQGPAIFDGEGRLLEVSFPRPQVSVTVVPGIAVENLACGVNPGGRGALLSWDPPLAAEHFEGVRIYRGGAVIRPLVLPSVKSITDEEAPRQNVTYEVVAISSGAEQLARASCAVDLTVLPALFIRGDVNLDRKSNISDPILVLNHLFFEGALRCADSADFDDSGSLDLTDAVALLARLFQGGAAPPPPYPEEGTDPTADPLDCGS